ncbi:thioredoxin family protein [bacterium]|nr:thioredoxin family protein [bacterium]
MKLKIFWQEDCPRCPAAKKLGKELEMEGVEVCYYDVKTLEGLAEASFYSVSSTPGIIIVNDDDEEIAGWRGTTPTKEEIYSYLNKGE